MPNTRLTSWLTLRNWQSVGNSELLVFLFVVCNGERLVNPMATDSEGLPDTERERTGETEEDEGLFFPAQLARIQQMIASHGRTNTSTTTSSADSTSASTGELSEALEAVVRHKPVQLRAQPALR